jgi:hypothetical protein
VTPPSLASRLRAMAEEFAAIPERPSAEVSLAAANVLRGFADDVAKLEHECTDLHRENDSLLEAEREAGEAWDAAAKQVMGEDYAAWAKARGVDGGASGDAPGMTTPANHKDDPPIEAEVSGWDVRGYQPPLREKLEALIVKWRADSHRLCWQNWYTPLKVFQGCADELAEVVGRLPGEEKP